MAQGNAVNTKFGETNPTKAKAIKIWTLVTIVGGVLLGILWILDGSALPSLAVLVGFIVAVGWAAIALLIERPESGHLVRD